MDEAPERIGPWVLEDGPGDPERASLRWCHHESSGVVGVLERVALRGDAARLRFVREGDVLDLLEHPNAVRVLDRGRDDGTAWLVMERIGAPDLSTACADGPLAPSIVLTVGRDVADALHHAHTHRIAHRALEPAAVLVRDGGRGVLVGLGVAQADVRTRIAAPTWPSHVRYLPPEAFTGEEPDALRADVYALGVILWEALTGRIAFPDAPDALREAKAHAAPLDPGAPHLEALRDLVQHATQPDPEGRLFPMRALRDGLDVLLDPQGSIVDSWQPPRRLALPFVAALVALTTTGLVVGFSIQEPGPASPRKPAPPTVVVAPSPQLDLDAPITAYVLGPSRAVAGDAPWAAHIDALPTRDHRLVELVEREVTRQVRSWRFFAELEAAAPLWADVLEQVRAAELPEVLAAIPMIESHYRPDRVSHLCRAGLWQVEPEAMVHARQLGVAAAVEACTLRGEGPWSATEPAPAYPIGRAPYVAQDEGGFVCLLSDCARDDRLDPAIATRAALAVLGEVWNDPDVRASGAAVGLTVLSHTTGWDGARFDRPGKFDLRPLLAAWSAEHPDGARYTILGDLAACDDDQAPDFCGSPLPPPAQHYVPRVIAAHLLAVCYYGREHASAPAFAPWADPTSAGWCDAFALPTAAEVRARASR